VAEVEVLPKCVFNGVGDIAQPLMRRKAYRAIEALRGSDMTVSMYV